MKKNIFYIYIFAICYTTVIVSIISLGFFLVGLISFFQPQFTLEKHTFKCYRSNENYELCLIKDSRYYPPTESYEISPKLKSYQLLSAKQKTEQRLQDFDYELELEVRDGFQQMLFSSIFVLLGLFFFYIHWNFAKKYRNYS